MVLFIIFIGLFLANKNGFYETKVKKETYLTNEAIKRFEKDVEDGKKIDINNYFVKTETNYNNRFNEAGEKIGLSINALFTKGFKNIWQIIKVLFM